MATGPGGEGRRPRVLVVDDEMHLRLYIRAVFESAGYEAVAVGDGDAAFRKALEWRPDLVSLDLMMPRQGGVRFYQRLRAEPQLAGVRVLVVSAVGSGTFRHSLAMLRAGLATGGGEGSSLPDPEGYVEKPPSPEALLAEARRILRRRPGRGSGEQTEANPKEASDGQEDHGGGR